MTMLGSFAEPRCAVGELPSSLPRELSNSRLTFSEHLYALILALIWSSHFSLR